MSSSIHMAAYSAVAGLIWHRSGYGGISSLPIRGRCGGLVLGCASPSLSTLGSVSTDRRTSPWLMLEPEKEGMEWVYKFFSLAEKRVLSFNWSAKHCLDFDPFHRCTELVGTSRGWLGVVNYTTGDMALINPITRRHVKLPSLHLLSDVVSHIILSCSPDEEDGDCRALIVYDDLNRLAFCCPGRSDAKWTPLGDSNDDYCCYRSFAYSKRQKLFFSVNHRQVLQAWDLGDPLSPKQFLIDISLERDGPPYPWRDKKLVVNEDTDDLFVVNHKWHADSTFDVHRYDPESGTFKYMERGGSSLDGLSFFIGRKMNGFALKFPELKPNSIYFALGLTLFQGHDVVSTFSYKDGTISPCSGLPNSKTPWHMLFTPNTSN